MKKLLTALAAALGITVTAAYMLVFNVKDTDVVKWRLTRVDSLLTYPDGGIEYRTVNVPVLQLTDGGLSQLPDRHVVSCGLSVKLGALAVADVGSCVDGGTAPITVEWVNGEHDVPDPDCTDTDACGTGAGASLAAGNCACSTGTNCQEKLLDGGWGPARTGITLGAGQWQGSGCVQRVCTVFSTGAYPDPGWPKECPL